MTEWLSGWKAIAKYCGYDVATVLKWHKDHGMPVYDTPTGGKIALKWMLDRWIIHFNRLRQRNGRSEITLSDSEF